MNWRIILAFLVAPALGPLAAQLFSGFTEPGRIDQMLMLGTSYVMALLTGMPLHEYLQRKGWVRLTHYVIAGAILGAMPGVALSMSAEWFPRSAALNPIFSTVSMGAPTAAAFWFIGLYSRERGGTSGSDAT
ncbi:hypothetical protein ACFPN2_25070 [Steroidobacter flavus]|uniref:Uncharacterized protein n=1 Tax=Steroidobacter flavus TaxID=1842136 RepID=A0ABV8SXP0_9GAMM